MVKYFSSKSKCPCMLKSWWYKCCGSILSLVQIFFSFVSNSLSYITIPKKKEKKIWTKDKIEPQHTYTHIHIQTHYHTLQYPKTKEYKIWTKDKIEPQHKQVLINCTAHGYILLCHFFLTLWFLGATANQYEAHYEPKRPLIKATTKFLNVIGYNQLSLRTDRTVNASCL